MKGKPPDQSIPLKNPLFVPLPKQSLHTPLSANRTLNLAGDLCPYLSRGVAYEKVIQGLLVPTQAVEVDMSCRKRASLSHVGICPCEILHIRNFTFRVLLGD